METVWTGTVVAALALTVLGCGSAQTDSLLTKDVPEVVRADCERAAAKLSSGTVFCPPLVPRGPTASQNRSSRGRVSITASGNSYVLNFVSESLAGVDPAQPSSFRRHLGHWLVLASSPARTKFRWLTRGYGAKVIARRRIAGVPVTVVERLADTESLDAGHVSVVWIEGGRAIEVSLHGFEHRAQAIEMARALIEESKG